MSLTPSERRRAYLQGALWGLGYSALCVLVLWLSIALSGCGMSQLERHTTAAGALPAKALTLIPIFASEEEVAEVVRKRREAKLLESRK